MTEKKDEDRKEDDIREQVRRISERCDESYPKGVRLVEFMDEFVPDIHRRIRMAEEDIKQLKERDFIINDIPNVVERTVDKAFNSFSSKIDKDIEKINEKITPLVTSRARFIRVFFWIGVILTPLILLGMSADDIRSVFLAALKVYTPIP